MDAEPSKKILELDRLIRRDAEGYVVGVSDKCSGRTLLNAYETAQAYIRNAEKHLKFSQHPQIAEIYEKAQYGVRNGNPLARSMLLAAAGNPDILPTLESKEIRNWMKSVASTNVGYDDIPNILRALFVAGDIFSGVSKSGKLGSSRGFGF